ncbi:hypothetical protein Daura_50325 [Dactylosporangium aurantiacum]|uniref:Uncharacterized protein n=1 Tax=Dactylosporangium aurantiacum TaxID=35754 RepID=A0A9Q9IK42_9ACTN|nr:hypothetical protein [Dactylosporangium aurantiacum]MDG6109036.1 hypothetical protein [Dactylosporangium aurantiacum]UWZ54538.1 hypothetical protein Daura_50325 [Dactylosporangium aurantiacum]
MQELHVSLDDAQLSPAAQKLQEPLEAQLSSALQRAAEQVEQDYHGESAAEVSARLLEIARSSLHPDIAAAFRPHPDELARAARAVIEAARTERG